MNRRDQRIFRKKLLIHPQFQLTLIALNWGVITLIFGILRIQASRIFSDLSPLTGFSKISGDFAAHYLNYQADQFNTILLHYYIVAMLASGTLTVIASYRFAGPLARLKGYFSSLSNPKNPVIELSFRSGDFFSDLPPIVNLAVKRLQEENTARLQAIQRKAS